MKKILLMVCLLAPLSTQALTLQWPLDCTLGTDCFIQNLVDHGTAGVARDYACGNATYPGHSGTDIRLRDKAAMRAGVIVRAAADGVVLGTRSNVEDAGNAQVSTKQCGNGVNIQHAEGYTTQYCHMRKGSILVHTGDKVTAGMALGMVGFSGDTEFPHLHVNVEKDHVAIDPFTTEPMRSACSSAATTNHELWERPIAYPQTALLNHGFTDAPPTQAVMQESPRMLTTLAADAPAMFYWIEMMNTRPGDVLTFSIIAPDGSVLVTYTTPLPTSHAALFRFIGKKNSAGNFSKGVYRATVQLVHADATVAVTSEKSITIQ